MLKRAVRVNEVVREMKILYVITSLRTGGAEKLMVDLLPRMKECGRQVDLCVFDGVKTPFYKELKKRGVVIHELGKSVYSPLNIIKLIFLMRQYDIVHAHNTACQYYVAIANGFVGRKLYTTEHNTTNRRRSVGWCLMDKWMYSHYHKIVCISELTKKNLLGHIGESFDKKCEVIYNGIDIRQFENTCPQVEKDESYKTILMVSAFRSQKDQKTLIRALALLPETYQVWFAGGGEQGLIDECKILVKQLELDSRVKFLGIQTDVSILQEKADVIVLSSHYEGLSLSSLEGMASGKPFIASDVDGLRDIVGGYGILFPHGDDKALSEVIQKVCEDKDYREEVVKKCQERARMFDISVMLRKYLDLYDRD